jgi:hypothetical protein
MERDDDLASRAYPVNITIIRELFLVLDVDDPVLGYLQQHTIQLIILAFFWLLRPAEYLYSTTTESRSQAFRLCDVTFTIYGRVYVALDAPLHEENGLALSEDQFVSGLKSASLTFSDRKNAVKGKQVGQCPTLDQSLCPVKALGRIVYHLLTHNATPTTPLYNSTTTTPVSTTGPPSNQLSSPTP